MPSRLPRIDAKILVTGAVGLALIVPLAIWSLQGSGMRDDFIRALRSGAVALPADLRGKTWTERELAGAEVVKVPRGAGKEQAVSRSLHDRGRIVLPPNQYVYQGTVTDETTGIVHVFGCPRQGPPSWQWVSIHQSSLQRHIDRRARQLEKAKQQWEKRKASKPKTPEPEKRARSGPS